MLKGYGVGGLIAYNVERLWGRRSYRIQLLNALGSEVVPHTFFEGSGVGGLIAYIVYKLWGRRS